MCTEDSPSGLWRTLGKRVGCKPSGVRIPHPPPLAPEPIEVPGFLLLVVPQVFRAPSGPAAREIATRELAARSGRSRSPPVPSGPSDALHASEARSLIGGSARRLEARPGPAAAHGHRSQALPFLAGSRTPATLSLLCVACPAHHSAISHVIPLRIVYTFNLHRWN